MESQDVTSRSEGRVERTGLVLLAGDPREDPVGISSAFPCGNKEPCFLAC